MSVGVCIVNRLGISLAADSAGTILGQNKMVYNSMNKVFSLSRKFPYGAIIYNKSVIYNASVEQIIKEFRIYMDSKDNINDYYEIIDFFEQFLKEKNDYYKFNSYDNTYYNPSIKVLITRLYNELYKLYDSSDLIPFELKLNNYVNLDNDKRKNKGYSEFFDYLYTNYYDYFEKEVKDICKDILTDTKYIDMIWKAVCWQFSGNYAGILFAGYGKNDAFPKYMDVHIYGVIGDEIKYDIVEKYDEFDSNGSIYPVAQNDVINTFCIGITNNLYNFIPTKSFDIVKQKINSLSEDEFSIEQKNKLHNLFSNYEQEIIDQINLISRKKEIEPILAGVQSIQLSDLAFLSESLINLTSLKRTYALNGMQQTVGGPTDVAVISKSDGFIWIKRKHYFDKELNIDYINKTNN